MDHTLASYAFFYFCNYNHLNGLDPLSVLILSPDTDLYTNLHFLPTKAFSTPWSLLRRRVILLRLLRRLLRLLWRLRLLLRLRFCRRRLLFILLLRFLRFLLLTIRQLFRRLLNRRLKGRQPLLFRANTCPFLRIFIRFLPTNRRFPSSLGFLHLLPDFILTFFTSRPSERHPLLGRFS